MECSEARICTECNIVVSDLNCPLCDHATIQHPERNDDSYCCECAGPFTNRDLVVLSWKDDPYMQCDDGMLITICRPCETKRELEYAEWIQYHQSEIQITTVGTQSLGWNASVIVPSFVADSCKADHAMKSNRENMNIKMMMSRTMIGLDTNAWHRRLPSGDSEIY